MDYSKLVLGVTKYWTIYIHENQYYLGRAYISLNRMGPVDIFEITTQETEDLLINMNAVRQTIRRLFSPPHFNYCALANEFRHVHLHIIPRYKDTIIFHGVEFKDANWGKNYAPYPKPHLCAEDVFYNIFSRMQVTLLEELSAF